MQVSDDEDDTHPNIDTPSLFRWRHQARVEREEQLEFEKQQLNKSKKEINEKRDKIKKELESSENKEELKKKLDEVEKEAEKLKIKEEHIKKTEKLQPWNVDSLSKENFSKTVINKNVEKTYEEMNEAERETHMKDFIKNNEKLIKKYGMMRKFTDSKQFLEEHKLLVHEDTANFLVIWCLNLEMEGKHELMTHVAHQCICMQYMLELAKQLKTDPRATIGPFFDRIQVTDRQYIDQFEAEIAAFIGRIEKRAKEKIAEAMREQAEEEQEKAPLGPGGLDPAEVFESLPKELQECFESRDTDMLKKVIAALPEDQARYHMKRCVDSGLWVPDARAGEDGIVETGKDEEDDEPVYESVDKKDDLDLD